LIKEYWDSKGVKKVRAEKFERIARISPRTFSPGPKGNPAPTKEKSPFRRKITV
jgi:hypothetical protein